MPRRSMLSAAERNSLLKIPTTQNNLIRRYAFNEWDLSIIRQHRGPENRLGFAVHLSFIHVSMLCMLAEPPPRARDLWRGHAGRVALPR
jgi:hypothetical protein